MNPVLCLPPAAALAIVGIGLGMQHRSISALENETQLLRGQLTAVRHSEAADPSLVAARYGGKRSIRPDAIDWKTLATAMAKGGGISNTQGLSLRKKFKAMSGPELRAALDEIAVLGLGANARDQLESWMFSAIKHKDPQLLMEHFIDRINRDPLSWELPNAFQQWAGKDPQAAAPTDPDAVNQRLAALLEDQRGDVFRQGVYMDLQSGSEKTFANLVREHVPENKRVIAFSCATKTMMHRGGYEQVGKFLEDIEASPAERRMIAADAANYLMENLGTRKELDLSVIH